MNSVWYLSRSSQWYPEIVRRSEMKLISKLLTQVRRWAQKGSGRLKYSDGVYYVCTDLRYLVHVGWWAVGPWQRLPVLPGAVMNCYRLTSSSLVIFRVWYSWYQFSHFLIDRLRCPFSEMDGDLSMYRNVHVAYWLALRNPYLRGLPVCERGNLFPLTSNASS